MNIWIKRLDQDPSMVAIYEKNSNGSPCIWCVASEDFIWNLKYDHQDALSALCRGEEVEFTLKPVVKP
jgi:hypothetical protein